MHSDSCLPTPYKGLDSTPNIRSLEGFDYYSSKGIENWPRATDGKASKAALDGQSQDTQQ